MATTAVFLLVVLVLISEFAILPIEARPLKHCKKCSTKQSSQLHSSGGGAETASTATGELDQYQPTAPGRSPGVGHSDSFSTELDEYRPTAPGRSPGVGHSAQNSSVINATAPGAGNPTTELDQYRPTAPGRSPGVGHAILNSSTGEFDVYPPGGPGVVGRSVESELDQFRPTAPGRSPGVGH